MRNWVIACGFWILLYASVKLYSQHSWINLVSVILVWIFVVATVINYGIATFRSHSSWGKRTLSDKGYPRWFLRFAYDDRASTEESKESEAKPQ